MDRYFYLSLMPESLVVSMLPPEEFGRYLATGTHKRPHGQAMFFQLKPDLQTDYFDLSDIDQRCVPHPDGQPKHSVYLAIYRVLENIPMEAIGSLWLVTAHGCALELPQSQPPSEFPGKYHLYQEICPVHPLIASSFAPDEFCRFLTDTSKPVSVPRICFVDLELGDLAEDPVHGDETGLPYHDMHHVRDCLAELQPDNGKQTKTVDRISRQSIIFRCIKSGFIIGDHERTLYYPYPSREEFQSKYYKWWRCANDNEVARS